VHIVGSHYIVILIKMDDTYLLLDRPVIVMIVAW
jgi:hypothetical protein